MKQISLAKLTVVNAEFYAYHGVRKEERKLGGKYQVDMDVYYDTKEAALKDDISSAINYEELVFCISEVVANESYALIETIATEILNMVFDKFDQIQSAVVRIRKLNVPMRRVVDYVEIEQRMDKSDK